MTKRALADVIGEGRLMVAGARAHAGELEKASLSAEYIDETEREFALLAELDTRQEAAKAALKSLTEKVAAQREKAEERSANIKKCVKFALPQSAWIEFGIKDKR